MKSGHAIPWGVAAAWLAAIMAVYWAISTPVQIIPDSIAGDGPARASYTVSRAIIDTTIVFAVCLVISVVGMRLAGERKMRPVIVLALAMASVLMLLMGAVQWYGATRNL